MCKMINGVRQISIGHSTRAPTIKSFGPDAFRTSNTIAPEHRPQISWLKIHFLIWWNWLIWVIVIEQQCIADHMNVRRRTNAKPSISIHNIHTGIPLLFYGLAAVLMIRHKEVVRLRNGEDVPIFFLYEEDKASRYWIENV